MKRFLRIPMIGLLAATGLATAQAGTIEVSHDPATRWSDAGETAREREANLAELAAGLRAQAPRLPADQVLRVTLQDVDLAGTVRPGARTGQPLRVLRGGADWPRITLQYVLLQGDRELRRGDEQLADMNYSWRTGVSSAPLAHEQRLLADWFEQRILHDGSAPQ